LNTIAVSFVIVRKNAAHKESSREKSHIHRAKFNGRPVTARLVREKMAQQLFSADLALSSIWEKAKGGGRR
jgi:hypothetical protein